MDNLVAVIAGSTVLATVLGKLIDLMINKKQKKSADVMAIENRLDALEKAVMFLLLGEIKRTGKEYISIGSISQTELEAFEQSYQLYHKSREEGGLGGNGFAENVYKKVVGLPINED